MLFLRHLPIPVLKNGALTPPTFQAKAYGINEILKPGIVIRYGDIENSGIVEAEVFEGIYRD